MKKTNFIIGLLICIGLTSAFSSCDEEKKGTVTFGANFHVINCISTVTIFLDGEELGALQQAVDSISTCGEPENITKEIPVGEHTYKIEIRPIIGNGGCTKDISGTFVIAENECRKMFVDYYQLFGKEQKCDQDVIISMTEYENAPDDLVWITDMSISENCLKIKFDAGGCDGNTWIVKLIDSGLIAESYPCQRTLRLSLENKEVCMAIASKEISFNIEDLQIKGDNKVQLNISGQSILYEY